MPTFLVKLYRRTDADAAVLAVGELADAFGVEAADVKAAVDIAFERAAPYPPDITFGMVHTENGEPYFPMDLRRRTART